MMVGCVGARRRVSAFAAFLALAAFAAGTSPAEARRAVKRAGGYAPPQASIVVDAKTGRVLSGSNEDAARIPASLTKVMTLYMLFEQMERGRMKLDTPLTVSAYAAAQPATKLGLRTGSTIEVEDAIKSMVTLSANDASVVVAENIAGSESAFGEMMTRKARALGMSSTRFYNANGLPHSPPNITTARDLATLGRAIQDRFPKYFAYFSTRSFQYGSRTINGHNRLLGRVEGVDGIKTGYTRLSGFNLLTSVNTDSRSIVAVVLGGRSGASRDAQMANLIDAQLPRAYAGLRTAPMVAEASERARPAVVAAVDTTETTGTTPPARRVIADAAQVQAVAYAPTQAPRAPLALQDIRPVQASVLPQTSTPSGLRWQTGAQPVAQAPAPRIEAKAEPRVEPKTEPRQVARLEPAPAKPEPQIEIKAKSLSGWVIQLGATEHEDKAREILANAKAKNRGALAKASPATEKITKGRETLYRARFGGFSEAEDAQAACKALKRSGFACFATRA